MLGYILSVAYRERNIGRSNHPQRGTQRTILHIWFGDGGAREVEASITAADKR
jgi:hypothetical protein